MSNISKFWRYVKNTANSALTQSTDAVTHHIVTSKELNSAPSNVKLTSEQIKQAQEEVHAN